MTGVVTGGAPTLRRRVYELLEAPGDGDRIASAIEFGIVSLIILNAVAFALETVPEIRAAYGAELFLFEIVSVAIFTVEFLLRLWASVEMSFFQGVAPWRARLRFLRSPAAIIDLLAIVPFYLSMFIAIDARVLRVLRLFRLLKLARYSPALHALINAIVSEARALAGATLLMAIMLLFAATGIYLLEGAHQPDAFGSVPAAMWWAMATLTTVGYGDVAPATALGKVFGAVVMLVGLGMFALPIAIISSGFARELARRDFVVTWPLIARIPMLAALSPTEVAALAPMLRAHHYPPHFTVISYDRPADAVFFVASGVALVRMGASERAVAQGGVFGVADPDPDGPPLVVVSKGRLRVLELARSDFRRLEVAHPEMALRVREALARQGDAD